MESYYINQAGNGVPLQAFYGSRSQRGHGFFGRLISRAVLPLLRYLGSKAFETGKNVYEDFKSGVDITESFKNRGLDTLQTIVNDGIQNLRQKGSGIKSRRRRRAGQLKPRPRKRKSTKVRRKKSRVKKRVPKRKCSLKRRRSVKKKSTRRKNLNRIPAIPDFL